MRVCTLLLAFVILSAPAMGSSDTTAALSEDRKINLLIEFVARSGLTFERNGKEYSASDAAKHLADKRNYAGSRLKTANDFIEQIASRSSITGKDYFVRSSNGQTTPSRAWLMQELRRIEQHDDPRTTNPASVRASP